MSTAKNIAGIVPGVMALGLVGESMKMLPSKKKKPSSKKFLKGFTTMAIGVPMVGITAGMVNEIP
jgi:hypothetical protein